MRNNRQLAVYIPPHGQPVTLYQGRPVVKAVKVHAKRDDAYIVSKLSAARPPRDTPLGRVYALLVGWDRQKSNDELVAIYEWSYLTSLQGNRHVIREAWCVGHNPPHKVMRLYGISSAYT